MEQERRKKASVLSSYQGLPKEIYVLFFAKIINSLGRFIGPLLTLILTTKLGMSSAEAGRLITLSLILQAPCVMIGGKFADSIGRRKVICIFFTLSALTYLVCGVMPVNVHMAYLLILASCLNSFSGSAYDALVTEYTNIENRQAAFSLLYMGLNIGASIAPIIGGFLLERHMRILFYGDAVTTFMAVSLILLFVKDRFSRQEMSDHMEKHEEEMKESVFSVLKKTPILIVFALITSIYSFVYQQFGFGIPLGMDEVFGSRGAGLFGMLSSVNGLMVIFLTPFLIHLTKKMKIKNVLAVAGACYAGAFLAVGVSTAFAGYVIAIVLLTLGEILCMVNMATFIANLSKKTHLARINSVVSIIREVGSCISPIVIGALLDFITIQEAFLIIAVIAVIGAGFMLLLKETKEEEVYTLIDN